MAGELVGTVLIYIALGFIPLMGLILIVIGLMNLRTQAGRICVIIGLGIILFCAICVLVLEAGFSVSFMLILLSGFCAGAALSQYWQLRSHEEGTHLRPRFLGFIAYKPPIEQMFGWEGMKNYRRGMTTLGLIIFAAAAVGFLVWAIVSITKGA